MEDTAIRPVRDRVTDVLAEDKTHGFVEGEFLRRLLDEGARAQEQTGRNLHRLLAIAAVFVLLGQASISSISLSGLEIRDLRPIQIVLPSVIMFLLFEVCIGTAAEWRSSDLATTSCDNCIRSSMSQIFTRFCTRGARPELNTYSAGAIELGGKEFFFMGMQ